MKALFWQMCRGECRVRASHPRAMSRGEACLFRKEGVSPLWEMGTEV